MEIYDKFLYLWWVLAPINIITTVFTGIIRHYLKILYKKDDGYKNYYIPFDIEK